MSLLSIKKTRSRQTSPQQATAFRRKKISLFSSLGRQQKPTTTTTTTIPPPPMSPLFTFLENDCPSDVVPKIMAYCGPQTIANFSQLNRHWRDFVFTDITWRILCEELYKWSDGDELPSTSWREYYQQNPCVPVDYPSLRAALATCEQVNTDGGRVVQQTTSLRILLRPGDFVLREAITVNAQEGVSITIETMKGKFTSNHSLAQEERSPPDSSSLSPTRRALRKARNRMNCRSRSSQDDVEMMELEHPVVERLSSSRSPTDTATLILKTRKHNEPLVFVKQGNLVLKNLEMLHNCHGMDIWNGNAAIQVQPTRGEPVVVRPSLVMESVEVLSHSGRGIVTMDGGSLEISNSYVHDCAATGIYVGGPGTFALVEKTDVLHNGNGTRNRARGGVGRGHSGVYLEQGKAIIRDCNISRNSLTGISAVSLQNTELLLDESDLVANGAAQLEMPRGAPVNMDLERNNRLATIGVLRSRSGLVQEQPVASGGAVQQETAL